MKKLGERISQLFANNNFFFNSLLCVNSLLNLSNCYINIKFKINLVCLSTHWGQQYHWTCITGLKSVSLIPETNWVYIIDSRKQYFIWRNQMIESVSENLLRSKTEIERRGRQRGLFRGRHYRKYKYGLRRYRGAPEDT